MSLWVRRHSLALRFPLLCQARVFTDIVRPTVLPPDGDRIEIQKSKSTKALSRPYNCPTPKTIASSQCIHSRKRTHTHTSPTPCNQARDLSIYLLLSWWVVKPKWDDRLWGPGNLDSHTEVRREPQTRQLYQAHKGPGNPRQPPCSLKSLIWPRQDQITEVNQSRRNHMSPTFLTNLRKKVLVSIDYKNTTHSTRTREESSNLHFDFTLKLGSNPK